MAHRAAQAWRWAPSARFSAFFEGSVPFLNPEINDNHVGVGDSYVGFKAAMIFNEDRALTFQLRSSMPTGNASFGLGAHHVSLEPALLFSQRLTDRHGPTYLWGRVEDTGQFR